MPLLEAERHRVVALDLPGHGDDSIAVSALTLDAYVARIRAAVEAADEPVILVGHSLGGIAITQAAEVVPARIATPSSGSATSRTSRSRAVALFPRAWPQSVLR